MLKGWNTHIFNNVREKLLSAAMKLLYAERSGEAFDSQLVVGVRESFGKPFYPSSTSSTCVLCEAIRRLHKRRNAYTSSTQE